MTRPRSQHVRILCAHDSAFAPRCRTEIYPHRRHCRYSRVSLTEESLDYSLTVVTSYITSANLLTLSHKELVCLDAEFQNKMSATTNGYKHSSERIAHTEEKHLPGGWVVLKFGGTSVGKFAENIAAIVKYGILGAHTKREKEP